MNQIQAAELVAEVLRTDERFHSVWVGRDLVPGTPLKVLPVLPNGLTLSVTVEILAQP